MSALDVIDGGGAGTPIRVVAVIDIGSTSIRMEIAQIHDSGDIRALETLQMPVALGKDCFTRRTLSRRTIEDCVRIIEGFQAVMKEYDIRGESDVRAVATSAVREASNRDELIDRIFIATGIPVEVIDEAGVNRLTYRAILPKLKARASLRQSATLVVEIGGGSTELLLLQDGAMTYSETFRLGSQRMREMLDAFHTPVRRMRGIMDTHIQRTMEQIRVSLPRLDGKLQLLVMGGDARFAASEIDRDWDQIQLATVKLKDLIKLSDEVNSLTVDVIVQTYHLTAADAELVGPALLILVHLAETLKQSRLVVTPDNLRDGLLAELAAGADWTQDITKQIIQSTRDVGRRYRYDENHAKQVADLSMALFDQLQELHQLAPRYRLLLRVAALLHEVGLVVGSRGHHKHSMYLIQNSNVFGLDSRDLMMVAQTARYHRRAHPRPTHLGYGQLPRENRIAVSKMAALLRVADALDRVHHQHVRHIECQVTPDAVEILIPQVDDLTLELVALKQKGRLFEEVFGRQVRLRIKQVQDSHGTAV